MRPARLPADLRQKLMAFALIAIALSQLAALYLDLNGAALTSRLAFLLLVPTLLPVFGLREWTLTCIATALAMGLAGRPQGTGDILHALDRAAFFAGFIYLVTLLKDAAQRSTAVQELGVYLTRQPPGRRYYALAFGGHGLGVLLNFGAISLLTPLVQRGVRAANSDQASIDIAEQRQISALLRGFSWMIMWSPTALTQAVLFTSFEGVNAGLVIPLGLGASLVMILLGRMLDRLHWPAPVQAAATPAQGFPHRAGVLFATICGGLVAGTAAVVIIGGVSAAVALMLVAPLVMLGWIGAQNAGRGSAGWSGIRSALHAIFVRAAETPARSAFVLGTAGFIGEAAAKLAPVIRVAQDLNINGLPEWLVLVSLPVIITLCGQIALSPILVVVFLAAVLNELPVLPADPSLIVFSLGAGWALSMFASPNASATLLISAVTGIAPTKLTWVWNRTYALCAFTIFCLAFAVLTSIA